MNLQKMVSAGVKFGFARVFPPTDRSLADALCSACADTDSELGSGLGDTLSSLTAGRYDLADRLAAHLIMAVLVQRVDAYARDVVAADPECFDSVITGIDPYHFIATLASNLYEVVRHRAKKAGSPLHGWLNLLQSDAILAEVHRLDGIQLSTALPYEYQSTLSSFADTHAVLLDRDSDLAELTKLVNNGGYLVIEGTPWAGKTALAVHLARSLRLAGCRVVQIHIRERFTSTPSDFFASVNTQLLDLLEAPDGVVWDPRAQANQFNALWAHAANATGGRLVLIVDALDEQDLRAPISPYLPNCTSIATVVVTSRSSPDVADRVDGQHPLARHPFRYCLTPSPHALASERKARESIYNYLRSDDNARRDCVGFLAFGETPLSVSDLAELLHTDYGRVDLLLDELRPQLRLIDAYDREDRWAFGHVELDRQAKAWFGAHSQAEFERRLLEWSSSAVRRLKAEHFSTAEAATKYAYACLRLARISAASGEHTARAVDEGLIAINGIADTGGLTAELQLAWARARKGLTREREDVLTSALLTTASLPTGRADLVIQISRELVYGAVFGLPDEKIVQAIQTAQDAAWATRDEVALSKVASLRLYYSAWTGAASAMGFAREARAVVETARRLRNVDPEVLPEALDAGCFAVYSEPVRSEFIDWALELSSLRGPCLQEIVLLIRRGRRPDQALLTFTTTARRTEAWSQAVGGYIRACTLLSEGRFLRAELAIEALEDGLGKHDSNLEMACLAGRVWLALERGDTDGVLRLGEPYNGHLSVVRAAMALAGVRGKAKLPPIDLVATVGRRDPTWPATLAMASEVAYWRRDRRAGEVLIDLLRPFSGEMIVLADGVLCLGAADRFIALLSNLIGRPEDRDLLTSAVALEDRMAASALIVRTLYWRVRFSLEQGDIELARASLVEIDRRNVVRGMPQLSHQLDLLRTRADSA